VTGGSNRAVWRIDRERALRTLTFWLRPEFVLRVINRFQRIAGFDRAIALASSALTAVIPLAIFVSAVAPQLKSEDTADRIIERYDLTGGGAEAVKDIFATSTDTDKSLGIVGFFFLLLAVLSFTRTTQRLFEQTWELKPLSVRNSLNGLLWAGGLVLYVGIVGIIHGLLGRGDLELTATLVSAPIAAVFLTWSGYVLSAKRIARADLLPFGIIGAVLLALYSVGSLVYLPHLFSTYATRYGVIGAVFAMISALFCIMVVLVGSATLGREVGDELRRIKHGERPAEDEVQRQWNEVTAQARERWALLRERIDERRNRRSGGVATPQEELPDLRRDDDGQAGADADEPLVAGQLDGVEDAVEEVKLRPEHDRGHGQQ
jgi:membrane protein